ncbi:hypothetical protein [Sulfitobacter sp. PS-8MA]|uniref:hypothetical protein n=1 Tax=Sulfitobacter sp. PS-8MA TaxID=3237707 RepID=UPI0034C64292
MYFKKNRRHCCAPVDSAAVADLIVEPAGSMPRFGRLLAPEGSGMGQQGRALKKATIFRNRCDRRQMSHKMLITLLHRRRVFA